MTTKNIIKAVKKLDGVIIRDTERNMFAICRGYDVEFQAGILTIRKTAKRHEYDAGSDYNPGGYIFLRKIKDLTYYLQDQSSFA